MSVRYSEDFKKEVVKAYMAGDKSIPQIAIDFNVAKSSVSKWVNEYKEECLYTTNTISESNEAKEIRSLALVLIVITTTKRMQNRNIISVWHISLSL